MKVLVEWVESYPELSLTFEGDGVTAYKENLRLEYGAEVPDELLRAIIAFVIEYEQQFGRAPTVLEVRGMLLSPT